MKDKSETMKIQFSLTPKNVTYIDKIAEIIGATTRPQVVRTAIGFYGFFLSKMAKGYKVYLVKEGQESIEVAIPNALGETL